MLEQNVILVCHTVSIWLTVTLAVWRYIAVAHPQRNREWCGRETTLVAIAAAYVLSPLLCVTHYLALTISSGEAPVDGDGNRVNDYNKSDHNVTYYVVDLSKQGETMVDINFWTYSVLIKLLPCAALTALSLRLVCALLEAKRRRETLQGAAKSGPGARRGADKSRQTDRTTRMLLAVLLLFLATELPQGLLGLMSGLRGRDFFEQCYSRLGELMDFLALLNSGINFILYCAMSRQFRTTFRAMFRPRFLDRWMPVPQRSQSDHNGHTNHVTQVTQV
ncbi:Sex peptide receptor [Gryllus bimaculatus]|nr:Sex peptide receptor [Gryllus bimaculatus]